MKKPSFDATISALDAETSALDVETSAFGAATSAIARRSFDGTISALDAETSSLDAETSSLDAETSALGAETSAIARSYRQYRRGVYGDIGDCGVGTTPQMCNRVTNHGDMSTFSKPAHSHCNVTHVDITGKTTVSHLAIIVVDIEFAGNYAGFDLNYYFMRLTQL